MKKALMMAAAATIITMPAMANEWTQEKSDAKFNEWDSNKDGSISKEEFSAGMKNKWEHAKDKAHEMKEKAADKMEETKEDLKK